MIGEELDARLDEERAKLDAFGEEVRRYFDQLAQEIEADFSRLASRLDAQQAALVERSGDTWLAGRAQEGLSSDVWQELGRLGSPRGGEDSILGRAVQSALGAALGGGIRRGRVSPRGILRRVAGVIGTGIGQEIAGGLGLDSEGDWRLSRAQSALEESLQLQRSQRSR